MRHAESYLEIISGDQMDNVRASEIALRERKFHDQRFAHTNDPRNSLGKYYAVADEARAYLGNLVSQLSQRGRTLEIGCGPETAGLIGNHATDNYKIDLSYVALKNQQELNVINERTSILAQMDACSLGFATSSFGLVFGTGIIHHLAIDKFRNELTRVISPNGHAVFLEPLGHNPFINVYRSFTPRLRSPDEHPLLIPDIERLAVGFRSVSVKFFVLTSLVATVAVRHPILFRALKNLLQTCDRITMRAFPWVGKFAWIAVVQLSEPRKPSATAC